MNIAKFLLIVLVLFAAQAAAQESAERLPPFIRTSGEAVVTAKPDRARIDVGVVTQADSSQAAVAGNAKQLEATLAQLRKLLGANADIKTISYTLNPNYRYPREGGEPTITGYTAINIVRVTLDDLAQVGRVIDTATATGANRIQNLQFTLRDERAVQAQALREAAIKARGKADALASALNLTILRVLSLVESSPVVVPMYDVAMARTETASTPIEPGTIEIRATVTLTVEVR
ncbi:MAG TPA: SIMPL domain-containing protein [Pyrinomonadaceae bacterium]|nr:SIMPL domain-containing protein [Pyrinomonadaceae bacterium]